MSRQLAPNYQQPSMIALEERIRSLEAEVAALTAALGVLSRALADGPLAEPGQGDVAAAARQAHDILLAARSHHG